MTDKEQLSTGQVAQELGPWFSVKLGQPVTVTQLSRTSEGFSWVNYTLTVRADDPAAGDPAAGEPRTWDFAIRQEPDDGEGSCRSPAVASCSTASTSRARA